MIAQLLIFIGLFANSTALSYQSWNTKDPTCFSTGSGKNLDNSVCYRALGGIRHQFDSHDENSYSSSLLRGYFGFPVGTNQRLHIDTSREFLLNKIDALEGENPSFNNQLHLLAFDTYDPANDINFMIGLQKPSFGADYQMRESQKSFIGGLNVYGRLINGISVLLPGSVYDNFAFSLGKISHHNPTHLLPHKTIHSFSLRYTRSTSLLYNTNFYLSSLITEDSVRKFSFALMQTDHKNSTTTLEFIRTGNLKDQSVQDFRISHSSPVSNKTRTRVQLDWGWKRFARFSYINTEEIFPLTYFEYEISHYTNTELDIPSFWQLGMNFKVIL
jgi:hypothetical protein